MPMFRLLKNSKIPLNKPNRFRLGYGSVLIDFLSGYSIGVAITYKSVELHRPYLWVRISPMFSDLGLFAPENISAFKVILSALII